jgi:glycosyltransferase involved in cell wall biosynthesis
LILVTQIGARRHYAVPAALERAGLLSGLYTDVCMAAPWLRTVGKVLPSSAPIPGWKSLVAREATGVPDSKITCLWSAPWKLNRYMNDADYGGQYARFIAQNEAFGNEVVTRGFGDAKAVYAFNGAAVEIFRAAKAKGLKCILDMTIAPLEIVEQLLVEERQRFPTFEYIDHSTEVAEPLIVRERAEWSLADMILCGSEYVLESLVEAGVDRTKCRVARWGYSGPSPVVNRSYRPGRLRVLIAGTIELRKGVPYALLAAKQLSPNDFQYRIVGTWRTHGKSYELDFTDDLYARGFVVEGQGPVPRSEMTHEYQNADVLLHPSLAEGSANVCYEAMAHGLPVIATPNAGSAITDGVDGIIIPIRDPDAIVSALCKLRDDPALRLRMGEAARQRAASLTMDQYQIQLAKAVKTVL